MCLVFTSESSSLDKLFLMSLPLSDLQCNYTKLEVTLLKPPPPPMPSEFQSNEPPHVLGIPVDVTPLPFGIPRCRPWYGYGYFLQPPNTETSNLTTLRRLYLKYCKLKNKNARR